MLVHRRDIDGLRAVAVIVVVGFHAFPKVVPGGFVGVDIFFVISGYLISGIIFESLKQRSFSFVDFYARRARRIFPALTVVLVACTVAGWFIMLQEEYRAFGAHVAAAAAFVSNFALLKESGYFGMASESMPLLHLWSLGIEEQYYLVWPLLVVVTWRTRFAPLVLAAGVFVLSFANGVVLLHGDPAAAFYLPMPRFWELMLGSALAFLMMKTADEPGRRSGPLAALQRLHGAHERVAREIAAWSGILLIAAALLLINRERAFPGWWALLPTMGSAALIFAGPTTSVARLLLTRSAMVRVGLISYPLYLWHWPILVFERLLRTSEPTPLLKVAAIGASFLLADLTYRFIEQPIRFRGPLRPRAAASALALGASACLGILIYSHAGFPQRLPEEVRARGHEFGMAHQAYGAARAPTCFLLEEGQPFGGECDADPAARPKIVLWGDSFAAHLYFGLRALEQRHGALNLAQYNATACPPIVGFVNEGRKDCTAVNDFVLDKIRRLSPDTVILAARWEMYNGSHWSEVSGTMIHDTVTRLAALGVRRIVVVGQFPVWDALVPKLRIARLGSDHTAASPADPGRAFPERFSQELQTNAMVQHALEGTGAVFVSPLATFCNQRGCLLAVPGRDESVSIDYGHLTLAASEFFVTTNLPALLGE